jgi:hypothetical protein
LQSKAAQVAGSCAVDANSAAINNRPHALGGGQTGTSDRRFRRMRPQKTILIRIVLVAASCKAYQCANRDRVRIIARDCFLFCRLLRLVKSYRSVYFVSMQYRSVSNW